MGCLENNKVLWHVENLRNILWCAFSWLEPVFVRCMNWSPKWVTICPWKSHLVSVGIFTEVKGQKSQETLSLLCWLSDTLKKLTQWQLHHLYFFGGFLRPWSPPPMIHLCCPLAWKFPSLQELPAFKTIICSCAFNSCLTCRLLQMKIVISVPFKA